LYAVKSIKKKNLSQKTLAKIIKEVEYLSTLDHPNIIRFHETYQDENFFHIVMDLCKGKDLLEYILKEGKFQERVVCKLIYKITHAISYCHGNNICHRDLKPENIIFESDDISSEVKIIDFGLSSKYKESESLKTLLGTPYYIAPEVLKGSYNEKCDIWAIGNIAYLLLEGSPLFNGETDKQIFEAILNSRIDFKELKKKYSEEAIDFLEKCLARDPIDRISAYDALNHKWFKSINQEIHSKNHLHSEFLENLRKFNINGEMERIVLNLLSSNINKTDFEQLKETFNAIDIHQHGYVDLNELADSFKMVGIEIKEEELKQIFNNVDTNHSGKIDFTEFLVSAIDRKQLVNKENICSVFSCFDFDNSGFIDKDDLEKAMLTAGQELVHKEDLEKMINEIKISNKISLEDFLKHFENNIERI